MIKLNYIFILLGLTLGSCNNLANEVKKLNTKTITVNDYRYVVDKNNKRGFVDLEGEPMTGRFIVLKDSIPIEEFVLENGYVNGEYLLYDPTGVVISKENFINGVKHGMQYTYFDTGELASEVSFYNGSRDGDELEYDINHNITFKRTTEKGIEYQYHYEEGKLISAIFDKNYDGSLYEMFVKYDHFENVEIVFGKKKGDRSPGFNVYDSSFNLVETVNPEEDRERFMYYSSYFR